MEDHERTSVAPGGSRNIVVCGFPKSGNTWLARLLAEVIGCPSAGYFLLPSQQEQATEGLERTSDCVVWKTHREPCVVLGDVPKSNVIYIVRDIRDVVVSAFHYWQDKDIFQSYCRAKRGFSSKLSNWSSWEQHIRLWIDTGVYWVTYESLLRDTKGECAKILSHLKIDREPDAIEAAVSAQAFDRKKMEFAASGDSARLLLLYKGRRGTHIEEMSDELQELIVKENYGLMKFLGYL